MDIYREIFSGDMASDVRREYRTLLSVGMTEEEAEQRILNEYTELKASRGYEAVFWVIFAGYQWELGRLSPKTKEKGLKWLEEILTLQFPEKEKQKFQALYEKLKDPMPPAKVIRKPTVHHSPWKVGTLLAYRIVNGEELKDHPCFGKYVLMRVVNVEHNPVSRLAPADVYDDIVRVSFYRWIGDKIPNPEIADNLPLIPLDDNMLWLEFDWVKGKYNKPDLTVIGCDDHFQENPMGMNFHTVPYTIAHCIPIDYLLKERLENLLQDVESSC